jgi:phage protein D
MTAGAFLIPAVAVKLGGSPLAPEVHDAMDLVEVDRAGGMPDRATLRFIDVEGKLVDDPRFKVGAPLEVKFELEGTSDGHVVKVGATAFQGNIASLEVDFQAGGIALTVIAYDPIYKLHSTMRSQVLRTVTVKAAVEKIARMNGIAMGKFASAAASPTYSTLDQVGETDWQFLTRIVQDVGGQLRAGGDKLSVGAVGKGEGTPIKATWGENLVEYHPRVAGGTQRSKITVNQWDAGQKAINVATATPAPAAKALAPASGELLLVSRPGESAAHANAIAKAAAAEMERHLFEAEAVLLGNPLVEVASILDLEGVGTRFGGKHVVVGVTHLFNTSGEYLTRVRLGGGEGALVQKLAGRSPRRLTEQLVVGIVTNVSDPDKLGRVKLKIPVLGDSLETDWARLALSAAGGSRGVYVMPTVNDEVIVGFEHGEIERPIVLGALHNGKDKPGDDLVNSKASVAARLPGDLDAVFSGTSKVDAKKGVTLSSTDGPVAVEAKKALTISGGKAGKGDLTLEATGDIAVKSESGKVSIEGVSGITIKGSGPVTVESSASLQLKGTTVAVEASGPLQLKGAMVMIG